MLIGYARVSTSDQTLDVQTDALKSAGCEPVFTDALSGAKADRPGLEGAVTCVRPGDTLVVWRLDRLGRSLQHLIETVVQLEQRGIGFRPLTESIDTTPGVKWSRPNSRSIRYHPPHVHRTSVRIQHSQGGRVCKVGRSEKPYHHMGNMLNPCFFGGLRPYRELSLRDRRDGTQPIRGLDQGPYAVRNHHAEARTSRFNGQSANEALARAGDTRTRLRCMRREHLRDKFEPSVA
jgi:hypothetical protein